MTTSGSPLLKGTSPYLAMALVQMLFVIMHVTSHTALDAMPPVMFAAVRGLSSVPFTFMMSFRSKKPLTGLHQLWPLPLGACLATAYVLVFVCNQLAGPTLVGVMQPTMPVYVALFGGLLGLERFSLLKCAGVVISVV
ncbi:hypothetical protein CYMTET_11211, partial [Cymbomonas tetramitiformis]